MRATARLGTGSVRFGRWTARRLLGGGSCSWRSTARRRPSSPAWYITEVVPTTLRRHGHGQPGYVWPGFAVAGEADAARPSSRARPSGCSGRCGPRSRCRPPRVRDLGGGLRQDDVVGRVGEPRRAPGGVGDPGLPRQRPSTSSFRASRLRSHRRRACPARSGSRCRARWLGARASRTASGRSVRRS